MCRPVRRRMCCWVSPSTGYGSRWRKGLSPSFWSWPKTYRPKNAWSGPGAGIWRQRPRAWGWAVRRSARSGWEISGRRCSGCSSPLTWGGSWSMTLTSARREPPRSGWNWLTWRPCSGNLILLPLTVLSPRKPRGWSMPACSSWWSQPLTWSIPPGDRLSTRRIWRRRYRLGS